MVKPRYDAEKDESRHAAASEEDCINMARRNDWQLKRTAKTNQELLEVDCIFVGETEFPTPHNETED